MSIDRCLASLVQYGVSHQLIQECDRCYVLNQLLDVLSLQSYQETTPAEMMLEVILTELVDDAVRRGQCADDSVSRDLLDTKLMGVMTMYPHEIRKRFDELYQRSPAAATDWFYRYSQDTDYIRRYRIQKDERWTVSTEYGEIVITINLSKPEKDPKAIAAAKDAPSSDYPRCMLCMENEGYAGRMNYPARQNHRLIPVRLSGEEWYFQYSPYVYYNEHCIVLNGLHSPMVIDDRTFSKLFDFITLFPHYFIGSNADLPIVGGSILSHEHFQGGRFSFPMENAPLEEEIRFPGYEGIRAGIVKWPLSVIRLTGADREKLARLSSVILKCWRAYSDETVSVFAQTSGTVHNTVTPIARRRGDLYEMDLVLRNNLTTEEHPLGVFHPHEELHHIKKENIGLIEVMGLAVLPSRLKHEMACLQDALVSGLPITGEIEKHAAWADELKKSYAFTAENTADILKDEIGKVFARVLEHAGVFKRDDAGKAAFRRFIDQVKRTMQA